MCEMMIEDNDFYTIWLEENGNPAIEQLTALNLDLAAKVKEAFNENTLSEMQLAQTIDVNPDEIGRWLNGRHTFSLKMVQAISGILATTAV